MTYLDGKLNLSFLSSSKHSCWVITHVYHRLTRRINVHAARNKCSYLSFIKFLSMQLHLITKKTKRLLANHLFWFVCPYMACS